MHAARPFMLSAHSCRPPIHAACPFMLPVRSCCPPAKRVCPVSPAGPSLQSSLSLFLLAHAVSTLTVQGVESDGGAAFDRVPAMLCTLQGGDVGVRARCTDSSPSAFSLALVDDPAAAPLRRHRAAASAAAAGTADAPVPAGEGGVGGVLLPADEQARQAQAQAAVRVQAAVRGRAVRTELARSARSALVGWMACDCEGGDGIMSGTVRALLGTAQQVAFGLTYPDPPVLLFGPIGGVAARAHCVHLDEQSGTLVCEAATGAEGVGEAGAEAPMAALAAGGEDGGEGQAGTSEGGEVLGWLALPPGKLWALEADESEAGIEAEIEAEIEADEHVGHDSHDGSGQVPFVGIDERVGLSNMASPVRNEQGVDEAAAASAPGASLEEGQEPPVTDTSEG